MSVDGIAFYISDNKVILTEGVDGVVPVDYFHKIESWPSRQPIPFWIFFFMDDIIDLLPPNNATGEAIHQYLIMAVVYIIISV